MDRENNYAPGRSQAPSRVFADRHRLHMDGVDALTALGFAAWEKRHMDNTVTLTPELIHGAATAAGGFTRQQILALGLDYPPRKGWLHGLNGRVIPREQWERFLKAGRDFGKVWHRKQKRKQKQQSERSLFQEDGA